MSEPTNDHSPDAGKMVEAQGDTPKCPQCLDILSNMQSVEEAQRGIDVWYCSTCEQFSPTRDIPVGITNKIRTLERENANLRAQLAAKEEELDEAKKLLASTSCGNVQISGQNPAPSPPSPED